MKAILRPNQAANPYGRAKPYRPGFAYSRLLTRLGVSATFADSFRKVFFNMSSRTGKTRNARRVRRHNKGKPRKKEQQNKGTTPKFSVHID
jgi:hypothetical protein